VEVSFQDDAPVEAVLLRFLAAMGRLDWLTDLISVYFWAIFYFV
jgi:hypothetical protein